MAAKNYSLERILTDKALEIAHGSFPRKWDFDPLAALLREIALTRAHILRAKRQDRLLSRQFLEMEAQVDTALLQMTYVFVPDYQRRKFKLTEQLREIDRMRMEQRTRHAQELRTLEDRLLALLNKHAQLDF